MNQLADDEILRLSWSEYEAQSRDLAIRLQEFVRPDTQTLCLQAPEIAQGLLWLGAAALLNLNIMLDEKVRATAYGDEVLLCPEPLLGKTKPLQAVQLYPSHPAERPPLFAENLQVTFMTSGSTGQPKKVLKSGVGLAREVAVLQRLFQLQAQQKVLALVRPFHIYGFLHAWLLPLRAGCTLTFWPTQNFLPPQKLMQADLLVAVPSHWSLIETLLEQAQIKTLVSSGAAFGLERGRRLRDHPRRPERAFEILGSTETGGIGFRRLDIEQEHFELLEGVEILSHAAEGTRIKSDFLAPEREAFTSDRLEIIEDRSFRHRGRADRVFKYAGKRYSLPEIEEALSSVYGGVATACFFVEDLSRAQGGMLRAWVERDELGAASEQLAVRARFKAEFDLPFPQQVLAVPRLPRDAQGKLQFEQLPGLRV